MNTKKKEIKELDILRYSSIVEIEGNIVGSLKVIVDIALKLNEVIEAINKLKEKEAHEE